MKMNILSQSSLYKNKNKFNKNYNYNNKYKIKALVDIIVKNFIENFKIDILKMNAVSKI